MQRTKIGIVEDEIIIADNLSYTLQQIGYDTCEPAASYSEAIEMIQQEKPDLVLVDIQIKGQKDGIELAWKIKEEFNLPFIFLTANADAATVNRAKLTQPNSYLIKPFYKEDLYTSIEIALHNFSIQHGIKKDNTESDYIFIKDGYYFHKIKFADILYLESENVYVNVYTNTKKLLVRSSLQQFSAHFNSEQFVRIHRSFIVNIERIQSINTEQIIVQGATLPISKTYREELLTKLSLR